MEQSNANLHPSDFVIEIISRIVLINLFQT